MHYTTLQRCQHKMALRTHYIAAHHLFTLFLDHSLRPSSRLRRPFAHPFSLLKAEEVPRIETQTDKTEAEISTKIVKTSFKITMTTQTRFQIPMTRKAVSFSLSQCRSVLQCWLQCAVCCSVCCSECCTEILMGRKAASLPPSLSEFVSQSTCACACVCGCMRACHCIHS